MRASRGEPAEHDAEERVAERRLRKPAPGRERSDPARAASGVEAVDERRERKERGVLGQGEHQREARRREPRPRPQLVEREAEGRAVRGMGDETGERPRT